MGLVDYFRKISTVRSRGANYERQGYHSVLPQRATFIRHKISVRGITAVFKSDSSSENMSCNEVFSVPLSLSRKYFPLANAIR